MSSMRDMDEIRAEIEAMVEATGEEIEKGASHGFSAGIDEVLDGIRMRFELISTESYYRGKHDGSAALASMIKIDLAKDKMQSEMDSLMVVKP